MNLLKNLYAKFKITPIFSSLLLSLFSALIYSLVIHLGHPNILDDIVMGCLLLGIFVALPAILTLENIVLLIISPKSDLYKSINNKIEFCSLSLGIIFSIILFNFSDFTFKDWDVAIFTIQTHSPIYTKAVLTISVLLLISFIGYLNLKFKNIKKFPPLALALSISSVYIGAIVSIILGIQLINKSFLLAFLPFNYVIILLKSLRFITYRKSLELKEESDFSNYKFPKLNKIISNYSNLPLLAAILALPLLGLIIIILSLFGQNPNSIIKAWTETADWTFSQRIPPESIPYNGHYLCTVAAGGHKSIVRPLRDGRRHGDKIVVNRQLCIANAFEQVIEERFPKIHRSIRNFYDKYGYPISRKIKSPYMADIIYILMKPLEWIFLIVLYLFDVNPEDRIAIQYPHSKLPNI